MKKSGFTLAEVLVTLMILGVIAALTIPSLIQNTQKKEEIVQLKKGLSMINQAIAMNYATEQKDFSKCANTADILKILKDKLAVTNYNDSNGYARTQDGLTYYVNWKKKCTEGDVYDASDNEQVNNICADVIISTRPTAIEDAANFSAASVNTSSGAGNLTGFYMFKAASDRIVPTPATAEVLFQKDSTKSS